MTFFFQFRNVTAGQEMLPTSLKSLIVSILNDSSAFVASKVGNLSQNHTSETEI